ncbi:N-6 DNA methylase [Aliidongia dinghuensis]|nr:N-6 DNA methylase [Aliidongia dinghuensis]
MADIGRASKYQAFKHSLTLLGLIYLQRHDQLSLPDTIDEPSSAALRLAEVIERHKGLQTKPLSQHLLSGLSSIEPAILTDWLRIASENWPVEGFPEWFEAKLDELGFAYHHDTPSSLTRLVASLFSDRSPTTIFDPACGTGGFLAAAAEQIGHAALFGQEMNSEAWAWAEMRFLIRGERHIKLAIGNTLADQAFSRLAPKDGFDLVLTNPPFGMALDPNTASRLSRRTSNLVGGLVGRLSSETAHVQEILASLSNSGAAAIIVPNGFLSRGGTDQKLREALVRNDSVQAILGLPERVFAPGTTIETAILVLNRRKPDDQKGRILLLDARKLGRREGNRAVLDDEAIERITSRYRRWGDDVGFSRVLPFEELDPANCSFSPARYMEAATPAATMNPDERRSHIAELDARYIALCQEYEALRLQLARSR